MEATTRLLLLPLLPLLPLLAQSVSCDQADSTPEPGLAVWYEDANLAPVTEQLPLLGAEGVSVNVALHPGQVDFVALRTFLQEAADHGVPVSLWPLLTVDDGYFPNVRNVTLFAPWWWELVDFVEQEGLAVQSFVIDLEPNLEVMQEIQRLFSSSLDVSGVAEYLVGRHDPQLWETGKTAFQELVEKTKNRGFQVHASTLYMVLDGDEESRETIQKGLDIPLDDVGFDRITFQVYRSAFSEFLQGVLIDPGEMLTPYVVHTYAVTAVLRYGERAGVDIGIVNAEGYTRPADLHDDIRAALAAGIPLERINVYSLQGIADHPDPAAWISRSTLERLVPQVPDSDFRVDMMRVQISQVADQTEL